MCVCIYICTYMTGSLSCTAEIGNPLYLKKKKKNDFLELWSLIWLLTFRDTGSGLCCPSPPTPYTLSALCLHLAVQKPHGNPKKECERFPAPGTPFLFTYVAKTCLLFNTLLSCEQQALVSCPPLFRLPDKAQNSQFILNLRWTMLSFLV